MTHLLVSVVIPAYNCEKTIVNVLQTVLNQKYSPFEVIVVDDGSTDQTAKLIKTFPQIKYFYQTNAGPAAARNRGAKEALGQIIFFTDSDCLPQPDWINQSVHHFINEKIGAVAGSYGIANPESILARCIHQEILFRHHHLMSNTPQAFGSYNVAIRRDVFNKVGGFNESYRRASGEDNDLSYKILKAGHKIYFEKASLVDHFHTTDLLKYLKEQYRHGFWRVQMYADHPKMASGDGYTFWKDIIEPVLCGLLIVSLLLMLLSSKWFILFYGLLMIFILIELFFSFVINKQWKEIIFLFLMMTARAFARTFGFSSGFVVFFIDKISKKRK